MIERYEDVPDGVDAVRAVGTLTPADYQTVVVPMVESATREGRQLRILCVVDEDFTGLTPAAAWEDIKLGLTAMGHLAGCAVVSDLRWVRDATGLTAFFLPAQIRVFHAAERDQALQWLADLPGQMATAFLDPTTGVVITEVSGPLRRVDIDAIATAVDTWLEDHDDLPGLVLHATAFPGWANVAGLVSHLRFVLGHQRRIARVALAVDGGALDLATPVAGTLLHPDVRHFASDELDAALAWTSKTTAPIPG